ncbi:MAG: butyrate kinase [Patescibacteria group bacterium]
MGDFRLLVVNPGSTSTKAAVFDGDEQVHNVVLRHTPAELSAYADILEQHQFRKAAILGILDELGEDRTAYAAVVGRGGLCKPIAGGVYVINELMLEDLRHSALGKHASSLAGLIAHELAMELNIPAYIVDPVVVDELEPVARVSGLPEIARKSLFHALNQKAAARKAAAVIGRPYEELNLIVAHLGGGITVGAHRRGRVIDVNNGLEEGPFSPERTGSLPVGDLVRLCFSGKYTEAELLRRLAGRGGLVAYLCTNDGQAIEAMIAQGNEEAELFYHAMAYQVAKEIGADAAVLGGRVDAVVFTGGLAASRLFIGWIGELVSFLAPIHVFPGEFEMEALAAGALRVLRGQEKAKIYR